jgi:hypothetical protein
MIDVDVYSPVNIDFDNVAKDIFFISSQHP